MKHFIDDLEAQLRVAATDSATRVEGARSYHVAGGLGAAAVAVALSVALLLAQGDRTASAFPVLNQPLVSASALSGDLSVVRAAGADLNRARTFDTPDGRGYAFESRDSQQICLAVPDSVGYGQTCAERGDVQQNALTLELIKPAEEQSGTATFVALLPEGATVSATRTDGTRQAIEANNGVVVYEVKEKSRLIVATAAGETPYDLVPAEPEGDRYMDCGEGRIVRLKPNTGAEAACEDARG